MVARPLTWGIWDIDFRKNFNATLRARFGPPIVSIPDLPSDMRIRPYIVNTDGRTELGIGGALDLILGQNGYLPINGLVGDPPAYWLDILDSEIGYVQIQFHS